MPLNPRSLVHQRYNKSRLAETFLHYLNLATLNEDRRHSGKIKINFVFPLICTTFAIEYELETTNI